MIPNLFSDIFLSKIYFWGMSLRIALAVRLTWLRDSLLSSLEALCYLFVREEDILSSALDWFKLGIVSTWLKNFWPGIESITPNPNKLLWLRKRINSMIILVTNIIYLNWEHQYSAVPLSWCFIIK